MKRLTSCELVGEPKLSVSLPSCLSRENSRVERYRCVAIGYGIRSYLLEEEVGAVVLRYTIRLLPMRKWRNWQTRRT